jgi:hypothetical protein
MHPIVVAMGDAVFDRGRTWKAVAALAVALASTPALADPFIIEAPKPAISEFQFLVGARYWYGMGSTSKDLYGLTRDVLNSRLTYDGMQSHSLEVYARLDHSSGWFWKGYAGGGLLTGGTLTDEDFPPAISPYSSTTSTLQNQSLGYVSTDFGAAILSGASFRLDAFVGYHYFHQRMKAFGCQQTASNPFVCAGGISNDVAVIVEDDTWQAVRVGLNADVPLVDRFRLDLEGAYLPYVWFNGTDNHLLRPDLPAPIREDGNGWGYQLEAMLTYRYDEAITFGVGARYWHFQSQGYAHFEDFGGSPQPLDFKADIYGGFLQASYRFAPL